MCNYHITPRPDGKWQVKAEGAQRASAVIKTQKEAIEQGRKLCIKNRSELIIHGRDGKIRHKDSYGNDPYPPKG